MSLTPASDIVGKKPGRGLTGLLLVAIPVLLVCWMVIWPIISAIVRTLWIKNADGSFGFSTASYQFFFSDQYSLNNLYVTLWTTAVCAVFHQQVGDTLLKTNLAAERNDLGAQVFHHLDQLEGADVRV
mgnify:CR=1 FL=1